MEKTKIAVILIGLAVLAFAVRWYLMPGHFFFGPEQGRDFLVIRDIVENHKFTLIGSKTDIDGVFHGPVYYYLAAIPFALSHGNPTVVLAFFIAIQSVSVALAFLLAYEITKKKRTGYIAAVVFAASYLLIVYARWLSNPPLSIPLSLMFILFLFRFLRGKPWYLVAAAFVYGLLGQAEFINYLLFAVIGGGICAQYWKRLVKTNAPVLISAALVGLATSVATYILFDLRHDFLVTNGVKALLQGKSGYRVEFAASVVGAFRVFFEQMSQMVGLSGWVVGCILVAVVLFRKTEKIPLFWLVAPPLLFAVLRHGMLDQLYAGIIGGFVILLALLIDRVWEKKKILGLGVFIFVLILNFWAIIKNLPANNHVFFQPQQPAVRYTDQLAVIDWVYARAAGRAFEFQAYTIPYFWQDAWIYLFDWRGQAKYGYAPTAVDRKLLYVIIQKDGLDPAYQKNWYEKTVSGWGKVKASSTFGEYTVEERMP